MAKFETVYSVTQKKRKGPNAGKTVKTWHTYRTKSLTAFHRHIHSSCPDAATYLGSHIITWFCYPIMPLDQPIVSGGFRVNMDCVKAEPLYCVKLEA